MKEFSQPFISFLFARRKKIGTFFDFFVKKSLLDEKNMLS